jgi:penicillin-binding protein 2
MNELSKKQQKSRQLVFNTTVVFFFLILFIGFFKIQVAGGEKYYEISLDNSVRQLTEYPVRGTIRDNNGQILVDDRPSFFVSVIPRQINANIIDSLAAIISEDPKLIRDKISGRRTYRPVIIKKDLEYGVLARLEERRLDLPGVLVEVESKRFYPEGVYSPHLFGYVGEVDKNEAERNQDLTAGELIGKKGLEKKYDTSLRGSKGVSFSRVDAEGRDLGIIDPDRNIPAVAGMDLFLTLDYRYQQFAESLMVDKRGSIVALDTRNGKLITFVSKPDFDPRLLSGRISSEVWSKLQSDTAHPLYSRGIQSVYPPGSTYKLIAAIAALEENIITPNWTAFCPGYFKLGRKTIHCWNEKGHGKIKLMQAIKGSCNVFFYQLGLKIGLETWSKYSQMFLFGKRTEIDLPNESPGLVPTYDYYIDKYGPDGWTKGNLANLAIGQGELLTTTLQMAQFAMTIANSGVVHRPHVADYLLNKQSDERNYFLTETSYIQGVSDHVYDLIREGMRQVCAGGTGWRGSVPGIEVAGKTGTAQNPHGEDHAWFIAFAPYEDPVIAIAVIVEKGGGGGAIAAPLASKCMEMFFYDRILPRPTAKKDSTQSDDLEFLIPELLEINPLRIRVDEENE